MVAASLGSEAPELGGGYGVVEGDSSQVIGRIADIVVGSEGVLILDDRFNRVTVVEEDGVSDWVGQPGPGPGEFSIPRGLEVSGDRLFVADERRVVHVFERRGESWEWTTDLPIDAQILDVCVFPDGTMFVLGIRGSADQVIHEWRDGDFRRSFGNPYEPTREQPDPFLKFLAAEGVLICDAARDQLIHVPSRLPQVSAFSREGRIRWVTELPEYLQMAIHEDQGGAIQLGLRESVSEMHMLSWAVPTPAGLVVQLGHFDQEAVRLQQPTGLDTYVIDPVTGGVAGPHRISHGIAATPDSTPRWLGFSNFPYPRVWELGITPETRSGS